VLRIRAGRVYPVTAPPIEDGAVLVDRSGKIAVLGPHSQIPTPPGTKALEFKDAALVPGLVNCHTHLELTHLAGQNAEPEFPKWIRRVRELKDATAADGFYAAAVQGVKDSWARGVTCVAETGSTGAVMRALHDLGGRGIVYQEVFGPDPASLDESMRELENAVSQLRRLATGQLRVGVSPHAPYTVSAPLYEAVAGFARRERLSVAVHLAESKEESEFVASGTGPFADAWRARGIATRAHGCAPVEYLRRLSLLNAGTLCIHCVQTDEQDVAVLGAAGVAIAHCPRSNRAHGHGTAPLGAFRSAGIRVGLGTDSIVSVGDLDLWAEARAAGLDAKDALHAVTIDGARALGWAREIGSLEVGKVADLAVFPGDLRRQTPSFAALTVLAGRIVHQA